jgi:L-alanine-DL-glutamate epimerase-like enolase superfamily enzyme
MGNAAEACEQACQAAGRAGITSFKIKVGDDLRGGVARIAAVRKAVGEDVTFT